ncbi:MAG: UDP-N-acetylmuramate dehydrogenase [Candidatus Peregrinibacteria bacterium]
MSEISEQIVKNFPDILQNEDLSRHCTFGIGGPADYFYTAKTADDLAKIVKFAHEHKTQFFIIGAGSNVLFDDKGFRGIVIKNASDSIEFSENTVTADSGVSIARLMTEAIKNNLSGLESWVGLPGTVGGAVRGNAGCNGLETKDILVSALLFNPDTAETIKVPADYFEFGYRHSKLKDTDEIVLKATFSLSTKVLSPEEQKNLMRNIQEHRVKTQPFGASTGSFFKNPSNDSPAGMLIDKAGLKGKTIGHAQISEKHGNFILNLGGATSHDVISLAKLAKHEVKAMFGIELKSEVQILSETGKMEI